MLLLLLLLTFIAPVRLTLLWDGGLTVIPSIWGITFRPRITPAAEAAHPPAQVLRIIGTALRTDRARRLLRKHVRLVTLQAMVHLSLTDAARTAVLTGLARQLAGLLPPQADVRILPDFTGGTRVQARCIVFFHLGTILIIGVMVLWAYLLEAREHPQPQPKEA